MRRVSLVVVVVSLACGGGAPMPIIEPPLHVTAKPPAAVRARWVFSAPEHEIAARLDLGDKKTLYVGEHGRRELDDGGTLQHASTLAEEALGGVMRDDKGRYVFVAVDGDTYVSSEPLGALERVRPPRTEPLESVATGRAAIVGIGANGVMRSTDYGATWRAVDYGGSKLPGRAASVALDTKGNGVLLQLPQRLFVTHDDGATWAPLASTSRGASSVLRDGSDRIFTIGYHDQGAILTGDKLADTSDAPAPIMPGQPLRAPRVFKVDEERNRYPLAMRSQMLLLGGPEEPLRLLAGDRVVELSFDGVKKAAQIRIAPLGEPLGTPTPHPELDAGIVSPTRVAAWNGELVHARTQDDDDDSDKPSKAPTTTILRSKDYGATWQKEDALEGVPSANVRAVAAGPRGWTYVGPLCPSHRTNDCKPPKVRPAGKTAYETLTVDEGFAPQSFAFDEAHGKVYALAENGGVFEGAIDGAKLTRTPLIDLGTHAQAITLDASGTLRAFERTHAGTVTLHERTAKGEDLPLRYLDIGRGTFAFAGPRGLVIGNHESWETSDAGDTWTRVPSNGATREVVCGAAGCLLDDATRIGWDLPAVQATNVVRASTTEPAAHASSTHPDVHPQPAPPVKLTCKVSGKGTTLDDTDIGWVDGSSSVRWAHLAHNYATNVVTLFDADKDTVHRTAMLAAEVNGGPARTATDERDDGMVAARYRFAPRSNTGKLNPVRVELVWWSPTNARVHRGTLPAVKPFRVSRSAFSGRARVVDGGLVFQGTHDDELHFLRDDGKAETLTSPGIPLDEVWHSGKRWVVIDTDDQVIAVSSSEDGGKTWAVHGWGYGAGLIASHDHLETIAGKPMLRAPGGLYEIGASTPNDPPLPLVVDASTKAGRCDNVALGSTIQREHVDDAAPVVVSLGGAELTASDRIFHDSSSGKQCTAVYVMEQGRDKEAYLYADKGGTWSGWFAHPTDERSVIEPFTCK